VGVLFLLFGLMVTGHAILTPMLMVIVMLTGDFSGDVRYHGYQAAVVETKLMADRQIESCMLRDRGLSPCFLHGRANSGQAQIGIRTSCTSNAFPACTRPWTRGNTVRSA